MICISNLGIHCTYSWVEQSPPSSRGEHSLLRPVLEGRALDARGVYSADATAGRWTFLPLLATPSSCCNRAERALINLAVPLRNTFFWEAADQFENICCRKTKALFTVSQQPRWSEGLVSGEWLPARLTCKRLTKGVMETTTLNLRKDDKQKTHIHEMSCLAVGWMPQAMPSTSFLPLLVNELVFSGKQVPPRAPSSLRLSCSVWCGTSTLDRGVRHLGARPGQATDALPGSGQPWPLLPSCLP